MTHQWDVLSPRNLHLLTRTGDCSIVRKCWCIVTWAKAGNAAAAVRAPRRGWVIVCEVRKVG